MRLRTESHFLQVYRPFFKALPKVSKVGFYILELATDQVTRYGVLYYWDFVPYLFLDKLGVEVTERAIRQGFRNLVEAGILVYTKSSTVKGVIEEGTCRTNGGPMYQLNPRCIWGGTEEYRNKMIYNMAAAGLIPYETLEEEEKPLTECEGLEDAMEESFPD